MASHSVLPEEELSCPVCLKIFEEPVLLSCSHSFCNSCLQNWWSENLMQECPLCKRRSSKNKPPHNLVLKNLCEAFSQQRALAGSMEVCSLHSEKLQLFCLDHQLPVCLVCRDSECHTNHSFRPIDEAAQHHKVEVQKSLNPLKEKLKVLQKAKGDWVQTAEQMKVQAQETEREINKGFEKIQKILQEEQKARIFSLKEEERSKRKIMKEKESPYACKLTLDPNTVNRHLSLSEDNRKVKWVKKDESYPDHPDRFTFYIQGLCREALTGRCYWEVDWREWVHIGVTYRGISRGGHDSWLGYNDKSWVLQCRDDNGYIVARHNNIPTPIPVPPSEVKRVGVYVDWPAGFVGFYKVSSDTLTHLYSFYCTFTQPLVPGFWVWSGSSMSLCHIE